MRAALPLALSLGAAVVGGTVVGGAVLGSAVVAGAEPTTPSVTTPADRSVEGESNESVGLLVESLGHPEYAARRDAQRRLLTAGLDAFDALLRGSQHRDPEVADACRSLLQRIAFPARWPGDPAAAARLLAEYADEAPAGREAILAALAELPRHGGILPLARFARFEPTEALSQAAARRLLDHDDASPDPGRERAIAGAVGGLAGEFGPGSRPAAEWLLLAVAEQRGDATPEEAAAAWREHADDARSALRDSREAGAERVVATLYERALLAAIAARSDDAAVDALRSLVALSAERAERRVRDAVHWAVDRGAADVADRLLEDNAERVAGKRGLYLRAEVAAARGDRAGADRLAAEALAAADASEAPGALEALFGPRTILAGELHERGLDDWSYAEHRAALDGTPVLDGVAVVARWRLANLLHDAALHREAAETLAPLVDAITPNPAEYRNLPQVERSIVPDASALIARRHLNEALAARAAGESAAELAALRRAIQADPGDADIVIAMHTVRDKPADFAAEARGHLDRLKRELESEVWRSATSGNTLESSEPFNQWAWLVANTEGDFEKAVRYSRRSLEVMPDTSSYLDTLGRCLFSAGRVPEAVEVQRRAVRLEPRMKVLRRQLDEFERALAAQQGEPTSPERTGDAAR